MIFSQNAEKYHLMTSDWQFGERWTGLNDPYLSPLRYSGRGLAASLNNKRFFLKKSEKIIETSNISAFYDFLINPAQTALMLYLGGNANYGVNYRFNAFKNLSFLVGGSADIDLSIRYLARNSNNPFNMDLAANLNFSASAQWKFLLLKRVFSLDATVRTPLIGTMFVPQNGASYYEMGTFDNGLRNTIHLSHLGNKKGLRTFLGLDIPIWRLTIRVSGNAELLKFKANDAVYRRATVGFGAGIKYSFIAFAGKKNLPPENFINP